jgi:acyl carrier protein
VREVDVDVPLSKQKKSADELDVVEIIMNVEDAFNIEIKDEEVGGRDSSVKILADIVSQKKSLK